MGPIPDNRVIELLSCLVSPSASMKFTFDTGASAHDAVPPALLSDAHSRPTRVRVADGRITWLVGTIVAKLGDSENEAERNERTSRGQQIQLKMIDALNRILEKLS
eukprot:scaffold1090_cov265-Pinguiococcus_pyrenoidosus.AAC.24